MQIHKVTVGDYVVCNRSCVVYSESQQKNFFRLYKPKKLSVKFFLVEKIKNKFADRIQTRRTLAAKTAVVAIVKLCHSYKIVR